MNRKARITAALASAGMVAAGAVALSAQPAQALSKIKCQQTTGSAVVDPIVHHNQPVGTGHEHQFFGNNDLLKLSDPNAANYADLEGKATNCANTGDTAGYWTPVLLDASGKPIPIQTFTAYYRSFDHKDYGTAGIIPADTRLVAMHHDFSCGQFSGTGPQQTVPSCVGQSGKPGHTLTAHVTFPSCWDGVLPDHKSTDVGDTQDTAHYAYTVKGACPSGFPNKMFELRETIQYAYTGNGVGVHASSDAMMGGANGSSFHGDYWQAWVPSALSSMVSTCITNPTSKRGSAPASCG